MLIESPWKVTLGTQVILDKDEMTDGEIVPPTVHPTFQAANYLRAPFADVIARGLVSHTLSFRRVKEFPSVAACRLYAMNHPAVLPKVPVTCLINGAFGDVWTLSRARVEYQAIIDARTFRATYSLTGTSWALTTATTMPVPGLSPTADSTVIRSDQGRIPGRSRQSNLTS